MRNAGRQPNFRRRRKIDCSSHERYQRLAGSEPCKINFLYFSCRICVSILWRCVRGDKHDAGQKPNRWRWRKIDCGSLESEQQLAEAISCEMNSWISVAAEFVFLFYGDASGVTCTMQGCNLIGDDGARSIAAALQENSSLQDLSLVRSTLEFLLLLRLSFVLSRSASGLTCAMQMDNQISYDGAKSIAAAIKENSSLKELDLVRLFV